MSAHGKHKKRRPGVHKDRLSPKTLIWNREHAVPRKPPWMTVETYTRLVRLRNEIK